MLETLLQDCRPESGPGPALLLVSGVGDVDLDGRFPSARHVEVKGLHRALRQGDLPLVVVLGDEALQRLSPAPLRPYLGRPECASFGIARACPPHLIAEWARSSPIEFVSEGQLPRRLAAACQLKNAVNADDEDRTSTGPRARMRAALLVLQRMGEFRAKSWARDLRMSRHALRRLCAATLGLTPEEVVWTFFHARVSRAVLHGRNDEQIAFSLGLANAYSLRRAYSRRGIPFPRP